jgi:ABC-2 type transport system permease protein
MQKGLFARFNSMPIKRSSVLWAHVLASLASNMLTLVIIVLIALLMGFRSGAGILNWLGVAGILVLFTLALTWVAVIVGLTAKSMEGATVFSYPLIFLPFLSSAFVPTETMPTALRLFAEYQPVTSIVDTLRFLLNAAPVGNEIGVALAWCVGIALVSYCLATRAYRRTV